MLPSSRKQVYICYTLNMLNETSKTMKLASKYVTPCCNQSHDEPYPEIELRIFVILTSATHQIKLFPKVLNILVRNMQMIL